MACDGIQQISKSVKIIPELITYFINETYLNFICGFTRIDYETTARHQPSKFHIFQELEAIIHVPRDFVL